MFGTIEYDINQFHPSLRVQMQEEIDRIMKVTPPFHGKVSIVVSNRMADDMEGKDKVCAHCGKKHANQLLNAYAVTDTRFSARNNGGENRNTIYFNGTLFGVDGDMEKLISGLKKDTDHGGLAKAAHHVLTHEYGHVIDAMIGQVFGREVDSNFSSEPPNLVVSKYEKMFEYAFDQFHPADRFAMSFGLNMAMIHEFDPEKDQMVSLYAYTNRNEMFAETFACFYHGDERQKGLKITDMMGDMIDFMYKTLNDEV